MPNTTYVSVAINTPAKKVQAYDALAILIQHIQFTTATGLGLYTMDLISVVFDQITKIITVILSDPLPAGQVTRYGLTLSL